MKVPHNPITGVYASIHDAACKAAEAVRSRDPKSVVSPVSGVEYYYDRFWRWELPGYKTRIDRNIDALKPDLVKSPATSFPQR